MYSQNNSLSCQNILLYFEKLSEIMPNRSKSTQKKKLSEIIQGKLLAVFGLSVLLLLLIQSVILGTVGTLGPEISEVNNEIEQVKLENEIMQAKIREYQTSGKIVPVVTTDLEMQESEVSRLELIDSDSNTVANSD
jgi:hypothetical protein